MIWIHVSELAIDRLLAGEVPAADAAAMRDHAGACARCRTLLDDALSTQRGFATEPPPSLPIPMIRKRRQPAYVIAPVLAAAAAVAFVAWPQEAALVRTKGATTIGFYVAHGDAMRLGATRETVMPGDRVQLFTSADSAAWVAVIGDDASGTRSVYVEPMRIAAGREQALPMSITLDATLGDETITAVFCPERFEVGTVPAGCTTDRFTLAKVPR
jgi:hypothetical protein